MCNLQFLSGSLFITQLEIISEVKASNKMDSKIPSVKVEQAEVNVDCLDEEMSKSKITEHS